MEPIKQDSMDFRISVAMATYNGAQFIREQLLSICTQSRKPDEIVVSDDGSTDNTVSIVQEFAHSEYAQNIQFIILTNNPNHGYGGNFEWAIKHTSGDLIFLSDQDDIWTTDKVSEILHVFQNHPDAACVFHNATLIDNHGIPLKGVFDERFNENTLNIPVGHVTKLDRVYFLQPSISWAGIHGMSMCISKLFAESIMPFPKSGVEHDKWITVCSIIRDACFYINMPLTHYRLHGKNACGNSAHKGTIIQKFTKKLRTLRRHTGSFAAWYHMGTSIQNQLAVHGFSQHSAYFIASRLVEIGEKLLDAETSSRLTGGYKLCKLYLTDMRYRNSGTGNFLYELAYIIRVSKRKRSIHATSQLF